MCWTEQSYPMLTQIQGLTLPEMGALRMLRMCAAISCPLHHAGLHDEELVPLPGLLQLQQHPDCQFSDMLHQFLADFDAPRSL